MVRELQKRIDDLERRPSPAVAPAPQVTAAVVAAAPMVSAVPAAASAVPVAHTASASPSIPVAVSLAPRAPLLDVKAIERDVHIDMDGALDGRKRRLRIFLSFTVFLVAVFGGLFAALARSYQPH